MLSHRRIVHGGQRQADEKIIAIPFNDPTYNQYQDIKELPKHIFSEMKHFFTVYKALEAGEIQIHDIQARNRPGP